MARSILMVTASSGATNWASDIAKRLRLSVAVVDNRHAALAAMLLHDYQVIVLDESMAEVDPAGAELLWQRAGGAILVEVNLGICGLDRILREVQVALHRMERESTLTMRAALQVVQGNLKNALTGLLLHTQLVLEEPGLPRGVILKLQKAVGLAGSLRNQFSGWQAENADTAEILQTDLSQIGFAAVIPTKSWTQP